MCKYLCQAALPEGGLDDARRQEGSLLRSLSLRSFPTRCTDSRITCVALDVAWVSSGCSLLAGFGRPRKDHITPKFPRPRWGPPRCCEWAAAADCLLPVRAPLAPVGRGEIRQLGAGWRVDIKCTGLWGGSAVGSHSQLRHGPIDDSRRLRDWPAERKSNGPTRPKCPHLSKLQMCVRMVHYVVAGPELSVLVTVDPEEKGGLGSWAYGAPRTTR